MCIEIWVGSSLALDIIGVRSVLSAKSLTGGDSLEIVAQLHCDK